ncbi:hypothetical protein D3C77_129660 [compost metagenome]
MAQPVEAVILQRQSRYSLQLLHQLSRQALRLRVDRPARGGRFGATAHQQELGLLSAQALRQALGLCKDRLIPPPQRWAGRRIMLERSRLREQGMQH